MKNIKAKSSKKPIIIVNLVLITVLMVVAVYAWFAVNADNHVKMYDIEVHSDNPLQLSFDGTTWSEGLNLNDFAINGKKVLENMKFIEVTGDGSKFNIPTLIQHDNYALPDTSTSSVWKVAAANEDYLDFTVHMRSQDPLDVYFSSASFAEPSSSVVIGADCGNKSSYGDFSKDCIVGALRVAAYKDTDRKFIWITNPEYHLDNVKGSSSYAMEVDKTASTVSATNFTWNNPYTHFYYEVSGTTKTAKSLSSTLANSQVFAGNLPNTESAKPADTRTLLGTLDGTKNADGYYEDTVTFRVWIEGCDTEARRALVNGKFNLTIMLDSFAIQ